MARIKMFRDDEPNGGETPSPRTTIVGGRPPEADAALPPVPTGIQSLLRLASVDPKFRRQLLERRGEVAPAAKVRLNSTERAILAAIPAAQLEQMIDFLPPPPAGRHAFLRQTAATAVVLLGGAVLADCTGCKQTSTAADRPPPIVQDAGATVDGPPQPPVADVYAEPPPIRPDEMPPPPGGIPPDLPPPPPDAGAEDAPPRPEYNPMEAEGGIAPHEPPPVRPTHNEMDVDGGAAPDLPPPRPEEYHPTRGIQHDEPPPRPEVDLSPVGGGAAPDLPPPRPDDNSMATTGGAAPDEPPLRPTTTVTTSRGGIAPDLDE
jgi:hypothetical protein